MISRFLFTVLFFVQTVASAAPQTIMELKDFKMISLSATSYEMLVQGEKLAIEKTGPSIFKVNGQSLEIKKTDTLEQVFTKTQTAYKAGSKRSAVLDHVFIQKAHAMPPWWFILGFGGMLGAGIGSAIAKKKCEGGGTGFVTPSGGGSVPVDEEVEVGPER